jgi:hypothetical protein
MICLTNIPADTVIVKDMMGQADEKLLPYVSFPVREKTNCFIHLGCSHFCTQVHIILKGGKVELKMLLIYNI